MTNLIKCTLGLLIHSVASVLKEIVSNACFFAGSLRAKYFPVNQYPYGSSCVFSLFADRNPFTVKWLVVPVAVLSFDAVTIWANTHVFDKVIEGRKPPITYSNPPASVIIPSNASRKIAPVFHSVPNLVGCTKLGRIGFPVSVERSSEERAATAFSETPSEIGQKEVPYGSAVAFSGNLLNFPIGNSDHSNHPELSADIIVCFCVSHSRSISHLTKDYKK